MHTVRTSNIVNESEQSSFTVDELTSRWRCHRNTIYKMIRDGQVKAFKIRRDHRVSIEEVQRVESSETGVAA